MRIIKIKIIIALMNQVRKNLQVQNSIDWQVLDQFCFVGYKFLFFNSMSVKTVDEYLIESRNYVLSDKSKHLSKWITR